MSRWARNRWTRWTSSRRSRPVGSQSTAALSYFMAGSTISIVAVVNDPVGASFADSLSWPGRNMTGVVVDAGMEVWEKRVPILAGNCAQRVSPFSRRSLHGWTPTVSLFGKPLRRC